MSIIEAEAQPTVEVATRQGFDYSQIDEGIRDEVRQAANSIRAYGKAMQGSIIGIGKRLVEVKGMLPEKEFGAWIEAEFDLSHRTAQNFMNVARVFGNKQGEIISPLSDTVLYLLAAPSTPDEARAEVEQAAVGGQRITVEFAKEAIRKAKPEPPAMTLDQAIAFVWERIKDHVQGVHGDEDRLKWLIGQDQKFWIRVSGASWGVMEGAIARVRAELEGRIAHAKRTELKQQAQRPSEGRVVYAAPATEDEPTDEEASAMAAVEAEAAQEEAARVAVGDEAPPKTAETPPDLAAAGVTLFNDLRGWYYIHQTSPMSRFHSGHYTSRSGAITAARKDVKRQAALRQQPSTPAEPEPTPTVEMSGVDVPLGPVTIEQPTPSEFFDSAQNAPAPPEPKPPVMPADLAEMGYRFAKMNPQMWAIVRDEEPENYESNWCYDPADCVEDLRGYLAAEALKDFETWLEASPKQPDLRQCLAILELAKRVAQRSRELHRDLDNLVGNVQPSLNRLIQKIEKVVKRGDAQTGV